MTAWELLKEALRVKAGLADGPTDGELAAIIKDISALAPNQKDSVWVGVTFRHVRRTEMVKQGGEDFSDPNAILAQIRLASAGTGKPASGGNTTGK